MRIIITIIAFAITMGGLFLSGSFHSATIPKSSDQTTVINSPSLSTTSHPKTASILSGIKTFIDFPPASSSPQNTPSVTPLLISGLTLPLLQRITPTPATNSTQTTSPIPIPSSTHTPTPTPSSKSQTSSTPSPSSQSTPSSTPTPSVIPDPTPSPSPSMTDTPVSTPSPDPVASPQITPSPTNDSISLVYFTSPISRGNIAEVKIQTTVNSQCSIMVTLPSNSVSKASGIWDSANGIPLTKTASVDGIIDWQWRIGGSTKISPPDATIEITCSNNDNTYSSSLQMTVTQ